MSLKVKCAYTFLISALTAALEGQAAPAYRSDAAIAREFVWTFATDPYLGEDFVARVGEAFEIKITTFRSGCEREGETSVIFLAMGAALLVYDLTAAIHPGVICTAVIRRLPHTVTLRFDKPGEALIQIWGRRVGPETPPFGIPTVLEHKVTVNN